jgi:hypothetical protein
VALLIAKQREATASTTQTILKQVDFEKQKRLIFTWQGDRRVKKLSRTQIAAFHTISEVPDSPISAG